MKITDLDKVCSNDIKRNHYHILILSADLQFNNLTSKYLTLKIEM